MHPLHMHAPILRTYAQAFTLYGGEGEALADVVLSIRAVEAMTGDGHLGTMDCEQDLVTPVRRSIAAARDLPAGQVLTMDDIVWVRPGGGIAPGNEADVLSKRLTTPVAAGSMILPDHLAEG